VKNKAYFFLIFLLFVGGLTALTGCTITPGIGIGVDFDYYGGKFHVRPTANIGITGHP
jgi:hypothetical protein